jgi:hypothetical protein
MFAVLVLLYLATGEGNFVSKVEEGMSPAEVGTLLKEFSQEVRRLAADLHDDITVFARIYAAARSEEYAEHTEGTRKWEYAYFYSSLQRV